MLNTVCCMPQAAILALPGATETSCAVLAQPSVQLQMGRACLPAVCGLRRASARIAIRPVSVSPFAAEVLRVTRAHNSGPLWTQTKILGVLEMVKYIELTW